MINGMTVEEYNAKERRRGSIVAKLHGYTPMEDGDTEESLQAEYLEITGEAYRSQEEEQADNVQAAKERRQQRIEAQLDGDHAVIAAAKANGFMDCRAVRDALGYDKPRPNGSYLSSLQVAFHWIEEADEEVVYLIPDGITDVTKSERTGCYPDAFARVLAAKEEWDADRAAREQKSHGMMRRRQRTLSTNRRQANWPHLSRNRTPTVRNVQRSGPSVTPNWTPPATRKYNG